MLTENDQIIIGIMKEIEAESGAIIGVILMLTQNEDDEYEDEDEAEALTEEERAEEARAVEVRKKKLIDYMMHKGKYLTVPDILAKCLQLTRTGHQYYPCEMYVKYIGDTSQELIKNEIYHVGMVLGYDEILLLENELGDRDEYDSSLFERQTVTKVVYKGGKEEDGTLFVSDGFEIGREYSAAMHKTGEYTCDNGRTCMLDEVEPIGFETAKEKRLPPMQNIDSALDHMRQAIEFGDVYKLAMRLADDCEFMSQVSQKSIYGKWDIVSHLENTAEVQLEQGIYTDCALATITESAPGSRYEPGTRCLAVFREGEKQYMVFVETGNEQVKHISIVTETYAYQLDEPQIK